MHRRSFLIKTGVITSPLIAGCTGGGSGERGGGGGYGNGGEMGGETPTTTPMPTQGSMGETQADAAIKMVNTSFDPRKTSVDVGATVKWVNEDSIGHDVTSAQFHDAAASWDFKTKTLSAGEPATFTFDEQGLYEYYCTIHGRDTMCGAVLVGDVSLDQDLPCGGGSRGGEGYEY